MTVYTIVAYLPNGSDYCRGCHMGSSDSDCKIFVSEDLETCADYLAKLKDNTENKKNIYSSWDYSVLVDGISLYTYQNDIEIIDQLDYDKFEYAYDSENDIIYSFEKLVREKRDIIINTRLDAEAAVKRLASEQAVFAKLAA
jgi:hypothetical protein